MAIDLVSGEREFCPEASPKVSKVKNNAGAPGLKKVARVFPIGLEPPARAKKDQHGKFQEQSALMYCPPWDSEEKCDEIQPHGFKDFRLPWPAQLACPSHFPAERSS